MSEGNYYVYITTNPAKTVLYSGVTNNLQRRTIEHYYNRGNKKTFAGKYYCYKLIYYEHFGDIKQAIEREKEIKNMSRERKEKLINSTNPKWNFISV
jgi:putative endonuclease